MLRILLKKKSKNHRSQNDFVTIKNGTRNDILFREGVTLVNAGVSEQNVRNHIEARAKNCESVLDVKELKNIQNSALKYKKLTTIPFTDLGNGERFVRDYAGE